MTTARTVALLFTDLEGSTPKWDAYGPAMAVAQELHDTTATRILAGHNPLSVKGTGDGSMAVFDNVGGAIAAALDLMAALEDVEWPIPEPLLLRMGIHVGSALGRDGDWFGTAVSRAARIADAAHATQILLSHAAHLAATDLLADHRALPLGQVHLKGLSQPETIHQLLGEGLREEFPPPRARTATSMHNLPIHLSDFVGRHAEQRTLKNAISRHRLVTLVGPGGVGKTRLAVEIGLQVGEDFPDGIWFADLGGVQSPNAVATVVTGVLGLPEEPRRTPLHVATEWSRDRTALLILDNCEHVLDAAADLAELWATTPGGSRVIATSRELLHVPGEHLVQVPPLLDDDNRTLDGVQLFINRAEAVTDTDLASHMDAIERLCVRLDGLPLAIELAAARTTTLTPGEILEGVSTALDLRGGRRSRGRHASLRAAVQWSYELLEPDEKRVLEAIAPFPDGLRRAVVPHVAHRLELDPGRAAEIIEILGERSLVTIARPFGDPTYRLLEAVRAFALEQGQASGVHDLGMEALVDGFLDTCDGLADRVDRNPELLWALEHFRETALVARSRLLEEGRLAEAVRTLSEMRPYYFHVTHESGVEQSQRLLLTSLTSLQQIDVMATLAACHWLASNQTDAVGAAASCLELSARTGVHPHPLALSISDVADVMYGDAGEPGNLMQEWTAAFEGSDSPWVGSPGADAFPPAGWASALLWKPDAAMGALRARTEEARRAGRVLTLVPLLVAASIGERFDDVERSLEAADEAAALIARIGQSWWEAALRIQRSYILSLLGRKTEALGELITTLRVATRVGDQRAYLAALDSIAYFALRVDDFEAAAVLLGGAGRIRGELGDFQGLLVEIEQRERLIAALKGELGSSFEAHSDRGGMMDPDELETFAGAVAERLRDHSMDR